MKVKNLARLANLEVEHKIADLCTCPRGPVDYRAGIVELGGEVEPERCPNCGRLRDLIPVRLVDLGGDQ